MDEPENIILREKSQTQKSHMLCDYIYMKYSEQVNPWKQRICGCQGLEREENGEKLLNGYGVFLQGDENVLKLDRGGSCTTL